MLQGRSSECAALERMLAEARANRSTALMLTGKAGIGKTALLEHAISRAEDFLVVRATGVDAEQELAFAGLHQLCHAMLHRLPELPRPQADALGVSFGLHEGPEPDPFLVGLAALTLLADAARAQPLLCVVDDAQWLDRSSVEALGFVARRLNEESLVLLLSTRADPTPRGLAGLDRLEVGPLADADARALLARVMPGLVDDRIVTRIVAESEGNPLALVELPRWFAAHGAGGDPIARADTVAGRIEASFTLRLAALPPATRELVVLASADPTGDPALLWRAAGRLGLDPHDLAPAEADGLLHVGSAVTFAHPVARLAMSRAAAPDTLRRVHRALADATDAELDPDRRAWHFAQATMGPDETVAAELERCANRAHARGGHAAAAAFFARAAILSPAAGDRARRALAAARAHLEAGAAEESAELLAEAEAGPLDELQRLQTRQLRANLALHRNRGGDAARHLLAAARTLEPVDPALSRQTYLEALWAAVSAGRLGGTVLEVAAAARGAAFAASRSAADLLLDGLSRRFLDGYREAAPVLQQALQMVRGSSDPGTEGLRWLWVAVELWDDEAWLALSTRIVGRARAAGALRRLPLALNYLAGIQLFMGEFEAAQSTIDEADAIAEATGTVPLRYVALRAAALRGSEDDTTALVELALREADQRREGLMRTVTEYITAVLYNGLGRYELALPAALAASRRAELGSSAWALPELIEAAVRRGERETAEQALADLTEQAEASATAWVLGVLAQSRALLRDGSEAQQLYEQAIDLLGASHNRIQLARARLLYGEWLRRERRRSDARHQLRLAGDAFVGMGAAAFAARAERELDATGARIPRRRTSELPRLTRQERQVVRLAKDGHTNPQIAQRLFISSRTVEYHLHNVFIKFGIRSRNQLGLVVDDGEDEPPVG